MNFADLINSGESTLQQMKDFKNAHQEDEKNFLSVRIFADKFKEQCEEKDKLLEKLAYKGAMLPTPSLITSYLPSVNRTHMGEPVVENKLKSMISRSLEVAEAVGYSAGAGCNKTSNSKEEGLKKELQEAKQALKDDREKLTAEIELLRKEKEAQASEIRDMKNSIAEYKQQVVEKDK